MPDRLRTYAIHIGLFLLTVLTTLIVGVEMTTGGVFFGYGMVPQDQLLGWGDLGKGAAYSFAFLAFLTVHEFGHYFTALYHKVKVSLPYYIPIYVPFMLNIGSLGAVIRLKEKPDSTRKFFDIGIAGPLAGFIISILILLYGFSHLPPEEDYVLQIHPEYVEYFGGLPTEAEQENFWTSNQLFHFLDEKEQLAWLSPEDSLPGLSKEKQLELAFQHYQSPPVVKMGSNLLFDLLKTIVPEDPEQVPDQFELMHYPWLFVGYLTLFFTALNLLPIGQLDGGHVIYGMFGRRTAGIVSRLTVLALILLGGAGLMDFQNLADGSYIGILIYIPFLAYVFHKIIPGSDRKKVLVALALTLTLQSLAKWMDPSLQPSLIWLLYALLAVRFLGIDHPPAWREHRVNRPRQLLGAIAILIFFLCFSLNPVEVVGG